MAISPTLSTFTNGSTTNPGAADTNFTNVIAAVNAALAPLTLGQTLSNLFPLGRSQGGLGLTGSGLVLLQRAFASSMSSAQFSSATPTTYLSVPFTPQKSSSLILVRSTVYTNSICLSGTKTTSQLPRMALFLVNLGTSVVIWDAATGQAGATGSSTAAFGLQQVSQLEGEDVPGSSTTYAVQACDFNATGIVNQVFGATLCVEEWF